MYRSNFTQHKRKALISSKYYLAQYLMGRPCKIHILWEGHKILRNLCRRFDRYYIARTNISQRFRKKIVAFSEYMNFTSKKEKKSMSCSRTRLCTFQGSSTLGDCSRAGIFIEIFFRYYWSSVLEFISIFNNILNSVLNVFSIQ